MWLVLIEPRPNHLIPYLMEAPCNETDGRADGRTDRQTRRQADKQAGRQAAHTHTCTCTCTHTHAHTYTNREIHHQRDRETASANCERREEMALWQLTALAVYIHDCFKAASRSHPPGTCVHLSASVLCIILATNALAEADAAAQALLAPASDAVMLAYLRSPAIPCTCS